MHPELASRESDPRVELDAGGPGGGAANLAQQVSSCQGDPQAFAQLIDGLPGPQREAALAAAHRQYGNSFVMQAMQAQAKDDDTIKVDTSIALTPQQRAADLLSRLTAGDAKVARSELARLKKFRPKLEAEFKQFCLAYNYDSSPNARGLFVQYLENSHLGAKPKAVTSEQQANGAMQLLFTDIKPGERLPPTTIGLREALDPRTELTDDQREKLKGILLEDGRTALQARLEAEQLWQTKKINLVIDVNAAYASGNPHLAAFTSAARDAGYNQAEIDMVTGGATAAELWRPTGEGKDAMPATLAEYQAKNKGSGAHQQFLLDVTNLDDARTAIAQGMTLEQLTAARKQQGYDPNFRAEMTNGSVNAVVDANIPMEMRPVVGPLLTRLCSADQVQRTAASKELQALIANSEQFGPVKAKALRNAIDGLQTQFGMGSDPMLKLLGVQLDLEASPAGPFDLAAPKQKSLDVLHPTADLRTDEARHSDQMRERAMAKIEEVRAQIRAKQEAGDVDREEASRDYEMMGTLYRSYLGDAEKADHCRTMARMYVSTKAEQAAANKQLASKNPLQGEVLVPRNRPDEGDSVRASTEDEKELRELEDQDKEALAEIEAEMYGKSVELQPGQPKSVQPYKPTNEAAEARAGKVEAAGGILSLIKIALEWYAADRRMNEVATRHDREDQLKERIKRENTVRVPPSPAKLRETIAWLTAHGHAKLAAKMNLVLDASLAFNDAK